MDAVYLGHFGLKATPAHFFFVNFAGDMQNLLAAFACVGAARPLLRPPASLSHRSASSIAFSVSRSSGSASFMTKIRSYSTALCDNLRGT